MTQELILGLDIGTSSVRAALCDRQGNMVPKTLVKNETEFRNYNRFGAEATITYTPDPLPDDKEQK